MIYPIDALKSSGASKSQIISFGVIPQILPSFVANHASFALSNNLVNFVTDFYDQDKKSMSLDMKDEIIKSALPDEMLRVFMHYKKDEWEKFLSAVTQWDVDTYLDILP